LAALFMVTPKKSKTSAARLHRLFHQVNSANALRMRL
jgi:hypothetical protein